MVTLHRSILLVCLALLASAIALAGCSSFRLPRFDPQGRQLFAPGGETTELVNPLQEGAGIRLPRLPKSAFLTADDPPECRPDTVASDMVAPSIPATGRPGALQVFPPRLAAPIGMEVILRGALFGEDGRFLQGRLLEWSLEEPLFGHFTDVGGSNPNALERIIPGNLFSSQKPLHQQQLASSRSASKSETVTRGTRDTSDDLKIERGQSWVAVSSDAPGITRLSLTASSVSDWNQQPATAVIHWLDVRWQFPVSQSVQLGQPARLETRITSATSSSPLPRWTIRYSVEQGSDVRLGPEALESIDVSSDAAGIAGVSVQGRSEVAGEARIMTEILVPDSLVAGGSMILTRHWTIVRWDGAALQVSITTPGQVATDQPFSIEATIHNTGTLLAKNVVVRDLLPEGMQVIASQPALDETMVTRRWKLGDIPAGESRRLLLNAVVNSAGTRTYELTAQSRSNTHQATTTIDAVVFPLEVLILSPATVTTMEAIPILLQLTNTSDSVLHEVRLTDQLPDGLDHVDRQRELDPTARTVEFSVSGIQPGETVEKKLTLRATVAGRLCHTLTVQLADGLLIQKSSCLDVRLPPPPPILQLQVLGPATITAGSPALYQVRIAHQGRDTIRAITLRCQLPESLVVQMATEGHQRRGSMVSLDVAELSPGEQAVLEMSVIAPRASTAQPVVASLLVENQVLESRQIEVVVLDGQSGNDVPGSNDRNSLTVSIMDLADPVTVGQQFTYLVKIRNDRNVSDKQIRVQVELPEGLELVRFIQPHQGEAQIDAAKRIIEATEIKQLLPRESLQPIRVEVVARRSGQFQITVRVESARSDNIQQVVEETTVRD
jgi:hypothetical protein